MKEQNLITASALNECITDADKKIRMGVKKEAVTKSIIRRLKLHRLGAGRVGEIAGQLYDYARKISEVGKHPPRISVTVVTKEEFAKLTPTHEYVEHLWNIISDYEGQLQQFRGKKVSPDRKEIYDFFEVQYDKDKKKSEIIQLAIKHFTKPKSFIERCYRTWLKIS